MTISTVSLAWYAAHSRNLTGVCQVSTWLTEQIECSPHWKLTIFQTRKWIPHLGGTGKFLCKCILYFYSVFLTLIHGQDQEDWPQVAASIHNSLCFYTFAAGGGGHGRERLCKEEDLSVQRKLTYASMQALLCYSREQGSPYG